MQAGSVVARWRRGAASDGRGRDVGKMQAVLSYRVAGCTLRGRILKCLAGAFTAPCRPLPPHQALAALRPPCPVAHAAVYLAGRGGVGVGHGTLGPGHPPPRRCPGRPSRAAVLNSGCIQRQGQQGQDPVRCQLGCPPPPRGPAGCLLSMLGRRCGWSSRPGAGGTKK